MRQYKEYSPFLLNGKVKDIAENYLRIGERFVPWSIKIDGKQYILVVFYRGFLPPRQADIKKFEGFLVLDKNHKIIEDKVLCTRVIRGFLIWIVAYLHPPVRWIPKKIYSFYKKSKMGFLKNFYENCKQRYEQNLYEIPTNPLKERAITVFRKLDLNVVKYYEKIVEFDNAIEKIMILEKKVSAETSMENIEQFVKSLRDLGEIIDSYKKYVEERSELMYEADKIFFESLKKYSIIWKLFSTVISFILKTPLAKIIIRFLPEFAKKIYVETMGYKKLIRTIKSIELMKYRTDEVKKIWEASIPNQFLRGQHLTNKR